jgi:hypothetical protein
VDEGQSREDIARLRAEIGDLQARQIERLRHLLDRDFPEWRMES